MIRLLIACMLMVTLPAFAAEVLMIDDFEYESDAALQQAWVAVERAESAELYPHEDAAGKTAMKMPCNFSLDRYVGGTNTPRAVYDRDVDLDLNNYGTIIFDLYVDDPSPLRGGTMYFHTPGGWYGQGFPVAKGWNQITLAKGAFGAEDAPDGWGNVDGIRICVWSSLDKDSFCAVDNLHARSEDIAVIAGSAVGSETRTAQQCAERISEWLGAAGVRYGTYTDDDVAAGALNNQKLAILAYNPGMSEEAADAVVSFIEGGGKVIGFYSVPEEIRKLIGVETVTYARPERDGQFGKVAFSEGAIQGLPSVMQNDSWNANNPTPTPGKARVIARWQDLDGVQGDPAVTVSETGAYMAHILNSGDDENKKMFLLSLVAHFLPDVWEEASEFALAGATRIGPFSELAALEEYLKTFPQTGATAAKVRALLAEADRAGKAARDARAQKDYVTVLTKAAAMRGALGEAYTYAHTPRDGEFRAVWNHSGTGDMGSWDDAMKALSDANFNAVVPNMWWAGIAHYDSEFLPHSKTFEDKGDQIAQAVEAGKKYGVEVHPWKVNWNLSNAPADFIDKLREEGRLQHKSNGEEMPWLCPSHPDNYQLELDTMLEVIRKYDVDGVHFDYIRYPHGDSCYCDGCHERFQEETDNVVEDWPKDCFSGDLRAEYRKWRQGNITRLVKATAEEGRKIKPYIKISAAVFGSYPAILDSIGQDWVLWCREGWLDFVCPMDYTTDDTGFRNLVSKQVAFVAGKVPLYAGIGQFRIPDEQVIGQMGIAREYGADGFILFNMGAGLGRIGLPKFGNAITSEKAILPHNAPDVVFMSKHDNQEQTVSIGDNEADFRVWVESLGEHRKKAVAARGIISIEDLDGNRLQRLADFPEAQSDASFQITRRDGVFRLAASGELEFEDGTTQRFLRRSRPYQFED